MDKLKKILCVMIGHSKIQVLDWGRFYCARCDDLIADALTQSYDQEGIVIVKHDCDICRENYKSLTWRDKLLASAPFTNGESE